MTAPALVESLTAAGVTLTAESGQLICDGPESVLTETVLAELAARKAEILAALGGPDTARPVPWPELQHQRWGPAVGDPEPGITIPPGHVRRPTDPAAERAAQDDRYAVVERACIRSERPGGGYEEPGWVTWSRALPPAEWDAWRARAKAIEAGLPRPGTIEAIEASMRLAWLELATPREIHP